MNKRQLVQLLSLSSQQHSLISVEQARSLGISLEQLQAGVKRGWLIRARRSVFAVAGAPVSEFQPMMAALLATGSRSVISHSSAAAVHGFYGMIAPAVELSTPGPGRARLRGVLTHRTATLTRADVQARHGLRVTSPIRTLIDLAPRLSAPLLGEILDEGAISRLWTPNQVEARYSRLAKGRRISSLEALLEPRLDEGHLRSRLEQRVRRVLQPVVAPFQVNHIEVVAGNPYEMDLAWLDDKIDGEVDGMRERAVSRTKFLRQCVRENILQAHGWRIVHFTWEMDDPTLIDQVAPLLAAGRRGRALSS